MTTHPTEMQKRETTHPLSAERTRTRKVFLPAVDIYETKDSTVLVSDIPGADEKSVNIVLEKNVLTITAEVEPEEHKGCSISLMEYDTGDYQRSFTISDDVEKDTIQATVKNGVLEVVLPKSDRAKIKQIPINAA